MKQIIQRKISNFIQNIIPKINDFTIYNLQFVDKLKITINNPKNISNEPSSDIKSIYQTQLFFKKNGITIIQHFNENSITTIMNRINSFIKNEINI